ncbi:MAG TPA: ATP-binding protein [Bryobacteraceae bacterium]|nr:ATP-binding protein [Bryobacteraceae bacterium]
MQRLLQRAKWSTFGALGVAALTSIALALRLNFSAASFCFLLLLVLQSLAGDVSASIIVSILAVGSLDYFFTPPVFSLEVYSPFDLLALVAFLATGLVITQLVIKVRAKADSYRVQQENFEQLYSLAEQLLALEPDIVNRTSFLEPFLHVFGVTAVCLFDAVNADVYMAGHPQPDLEMKTGEGFIHGRDRDDEERRFSVRRIRIGGRMAGAIGFEGLRDAKLTAGALAALAALHLERQQAFVRASRAAANAQSESYRAAILDALAHEFKTPLATILAAAGALREGAPLGDHHREMAETVESEAARLGRLTSRLIRTARLEREEVKPWIELIDLSATIADTVEYYKRLSDSHTIVVINKCGSAEALADAELVRLAVSQLLDNACKYSATGSRITLSVVREDDYVAIRVMNSGNPIPAAECGKIFDRYYRGANARREVPGSGLGLFVARKIALALGGNLDLDAETSEGVAFRLRLPVPDNERSEYAAAV